MPPKKKQQQIDLSTLPQCKSLNIFLLCKGKVDRSKKILNKIDTKFDKYLVHVKKAAVLDYAKEKGIYVDPQSLTDKQKKDPKFMETVCTELTPQVLAKATDAYLNNLSVKIRMEKKVLLEKPETAEQEKNKKIDCIYVFDDFPNQFQDFQALAVANQGIKFVLVIDPKISWASAPEEPEPAQNPDEQPGQPDEQYQNYKKLKQAEQLTPQDTAHQSSISQKLSHLRLQRKKSPKTSPFRNTVIEHIKCTIDPYTEQASIDQIVASIMPTCETLLLSFGEFNAWVKDKNAEKLPELGGQGKIQVKPVQYGKDNKDVDRTMELLNNVIKGFAPAGAEEKGKDEHIDFSDFDFSEVESKPQANAGQSQQRLQGGTEFLSYNERKQKSSREFVKQILKNMRYPGIDRFQMPQLPQKSQGLRKQYRSSFGQFLPKDLPFADFQRKMNILFLESAAKEADQDRSYNFSSKTHEEQHSRESLTRQLNKALLLDQSSIALKYNENNDKLYICLLYKNPPRRMSKKIWECNWKVLPNFENWLRYFKENQGNLGNGHYYDIDYQLIGSIVEEANVWSVRDSGVIVRKRATVAGKTNQMLYCLTGNNTGDLTFGIRNKDNHPQFYAQNEIALITQTSTPTTSIYITFKDGTILQLRQNGDTLIRKPNSQPRLLTRDGYTIIYNQNQQRTILHPNGGISCPKSHYVNAAGRGLDGGRLREVPTLRRYTEEGRVVTRRDDRTIIVEEGDRKWIKFEDQTEYLLDNGETVIEKKDYPTFRVLGNETIVLNYNGVQIRSQKDREGYKHSLKFQRICTSNASQLIFQNSQIQIYDGKTDTPYICSLQNASIAKTWENESVSVSFTGSQYERNGKKVDPEEEEDNYGEDDVVRQDYLEPRVFIVNNDSTGVELLSENQLKSYFEAFKQTQQPTSQTPSRTSTKRPQLRQLPHPESATKKNIYGILPIPQTSELNKQTIKQVPIDLDIYNNSQADASPEQEAESTLLQVRAVVRHEGLTQADRDLLADIVRKRNQYCSRAEKEDNEYGFKPKGDPSTAERFDSKRKVIEFRKLKEQPILGELMKSEAIELYNKETQTRIKKLQNLNREIELKKRLSKKKSIVSMFNWKEPPFIENDENLQYYNTDRSFYVNYFETAEGKKALGQMPDWVFRPKQNKKKQQLDPEIQSQLNATLNKTKKQQDPMNMTNQKQSYKEQSQRNQRYDTVEPELKPSPLIYIKPSVFTQREIDEERFAFETEKKAYEYHERKRKDFDVYGLDRKSRVQVPSLMRTQPVSQLNQKYLVTEAPVDKKVKISSMKNKLTSQASNMTEMRKEGPHANLIRTIDKGNDYSKLLEKRTMMVQADLNDRLQRDIQINPVEANFGVVREGGNYQMKIQIKNQDILAQRIHLKKPKSIFCRVQMVEMGPIALGMTRKITVILKAAPEISGKFTDEFDIVTKHEIYHIPITAQIISKNQFESSGVQLSRSIRQFEEIGKKKREELPPIKDAN